MKEFEITVKLENSKEEIFEIVENDNFEFVEKYNILDNYMVKKDIDIKKMSKKEILDNCLLIRDIIGEKGKVLITKKTKKYDEYGNTIVRDIINLTVFDKNEAIEFLETIGYRKLIDIEDELYVYNYNEHSLLIQFVKDLGIYLEIEFEDKTYDEQLLIKESINLILSKLFKFNKNEMDAKKAEDMLDKEIFNCGG